MLTCKACGSQLQSDGEMWRCPHRSDRNLHHEAPTEIRDKRIGIQK